MMRKGRWLMKLLYKCISGFLVLTLIGLYVPRISFCADSKLFARADRKTITRHEPEIMSAPEQEMPLGTAEQVKKKKSPWLWIGLGLGLAALAGIAGGGGGGGDNPGANEGTIVVEW